MKNWKTTLAGAATILGALANAFLEFNTGGFAAINLTTLSTAVMAGLGLIVAKDFNKTGV